jgi:hypothetical protein
MLIWCVNTEEMIKEEEHIIILDYILIKYNCLCAIKYGKVVGIKIYEETGGINKEKFINFINKFIKNKYKNNIILLDNPIFHKSKEVKTKIEETENNYLYSIRYKEITNMQIEAFINQLKHYLKLFRNSK